MTSTRHSYTTVDPSGRIVRVDPSDPTTPPRLRSRLETDDEVRARLRAEHAMRRKPWEFIETFSGSSGRKLDELLKQYDLAPRGFVDEVSK